MHLALFIVLGYLAGSIPFGLVLARARGIDLRKVGSGNIGATNAARALGGKMGFVVFLCDAAKGAAPVLLARWQLAPGGGAVATWGVAAVGAAAFLGHLAPPWLGFRGGKGVATAFGVFVAIAPAAALAAAAVFALLYLATRIASIGSLTASTLFVPAVWWWTHDPARTALALFMWLLIVVKHRGNISRLLQHREHKVERV